MPGNPHERIECKRQGDLKVMAWCGLVDGKRLEVRWMVEGKGRLQLVTSQQYQDMLQKQVWPDVKN